MMHVEQQRENEVPIQPFSLFYSGEVKLTVEPEAHFHQYKKMFDKCSDIITDDR